MLSPAMKSSSLTFTWNINLPNSYTGQKWYNRASDEGSPFLGKCSMRPHTATRILVRQYATPPDTTAEGFDRRHGIRAGCERAHLLWLLQRGHDVDGVLDLVDGDCVIEGLVRAVGAAAGRQAQRQRARCRHQHIQRHAAHQRLGLLAGIHHLAAPGPSSTQYNLGHTIDAGWQVTRKAHHLNLGHVSCYQPVLEC